MNTAARWVGFIKENRLAHIEVDADAEYDLQSTPPAMPLAEAIEKE